MATAPSAIAALNDNDVFPIANHAPELAATRARTAPTAAN